MNWHTAHDKFISLGSWLNSLLYCVPAIILALALNHFESTKIYIVPALLIYLIAALAHMLAYGFQGVCAQIKACTDYALDHPNIKNQK